MPISCTQVAELAGLISGTPAENPTVQVAAIRELECVLVSDTVTIEPPYKSYALVLGLGVDRFMHARGEGDIARPGAQRSIHFDDCELRGINTETETSAAYVFVDERLPGQLPWPNVPWKIGEIDIALKANVGQKSRVSLHIPTVAFQHLWDMDIAEVLQRERSSVIKQARFSVLSIAGQERRPNTVWVYDVGFEVGPNTTHPIVPQLVERLGQAIDQWIRRAVIGVLLGLVPMILVLELIRWFWP
jgi:hypothetical protein